MKAADSIGGFRQPAIYQFGNEGVGVLRAGCLIDAGPSLQRAFQVTERVEEFPAELRAHPTFGVVNAPERRGRSG